MMQRSLKFVARMSSIPIQRNVSLSPLFSMCKTGTLVSRNNVGHLYHTSAVLSIRTFSTVDSQTSSSTTKTAPTEIRMTVVQNTEEINEKIPEMNEYIGQVNEKGEKHGYGAVKFVAKDGFEQYYRGYFKNNIASGHGILYINDQFLYEGDFDLNKFQGKGKLKLINGEYEGYFYNNKMHGRGSFTYDTGDFYSGEWRDSKKYGNGIFKFANGDIYEGVVVDDRYEGKGILKWADGEIYDGEFRNGMMEGRGVFIFTNGDKYTGLFEKHMFHGQGKMEYANGDVYEGDHFEGNHCGNGKMVYANGDVYEGLFFASQRHDMGTMTYADGTVWRGEWENGEKKQEEDREKAARLAAAIASKRPEDLTVEEMEADPAHQEKWRQQALAIEGLDDESIRERKEMEAFVKEYAEKKNFLGRISEATKKFENKKVPQTKPEASGGGVDNVVEAEYTTKVDISNREETDVIVK